MKTNNMQFLKRLGWNGGKLLWRVFMILLPVVLYSLWQALANLFRQLDFDQEEGVYHDGTPMPHNTSHPDWPLHWGDYYEDYY